MFIYKKQQAGLLLSAVFQLRTGRRRQETTLILKKDVVMKGFKPLAIDIRAETTKTKEKAPLSCLDEDLERLIRQSLSNNKTEWLFPNRLGRKCTPDKVYEYLKKASEQVIGIRITPHYFRHRFITECAKANAPIADVKSISGIKDNEVLLKYYSHSTIEGQKKVLATTCL
ncbi:MAG: site-specific integrase [Candidatus Omnitrophica bacterium]|nr:site-specific integrase [Candidatus Omnitrophota bacterium]